VKNAFVLGPTVFAKDLLALTSLYRALGATALFCLLSGAVYLLNDVCDVEADRAHPTKRNRPIASGLLSLRAAIRFHVFFVIVAIGLGAIFLGWKFAAVAGGYFVLNLFYSLSLKHVAYLDVLLIATGFLLRVVAGAVAIAVPISNYILLCTFLLAMFLAMGKRYHELLVIQGVDGATRASLRKYSQKGLGVMMVLAGSCTAAGYTAYTLDPGTIARFGTRSLVFTAPSILIGLWRFFGLAHETESGKSPTDRMIRDPVFLINLLTWSIAVVLILYPLM
jgi:4-hydroxybenzoate polyprenyltransferase